MPAKSKDEYVDYLIVRGVRVPRETVDSLEQQCGGKWLNDNLPENWLVVAALDRAVKEYRAVNGGKLPQSINLREDPFFHYIPAVLSVGVPMLAMPVDVPHKPAYFRVKRVF